jgi:hypothetical protein
VLKALYREDKLVRVTTTIKTSQSVLNNYFWQRLLFASFSLYKYVKLVTIKLILLSTSYNIYFLLKHLNYEYQIQCYFKKNSVCAYTVILSGSLLENQVSEDSIQKEYSKTKVIKNNLTLILLILLIL